MNYNLFTQQTTKHAKRKANSMINTSAFVHIKTVYILIASCFTDNRQPVVIPWINVSDRI